MYVALPRSAELAGTSTTTSPFEPGPVAGSAQTMASAAQDFTTSSPVPTVTFPCLLPK